jgi:hypothetical protein
LGVDELCQDNTDNIRIVKVHFQPWHRSTDCGWDWAG